MSLLTRIVGRVRGMNAGNYPENREEEQFHLNNRGDLIVAQCLPERTELVRMGNSYISLGAAAAGCPQATMPTTSPHLSLWNGEQDDGMAYIIDVVGEYMSTTSDVAVTMGMGINNGTAKAASPAGTQAIKSLSGRANYRGRGNVKATGAIVDNGAWCMIGNSLVCAATANAMLSVQYPCFGRYIVPPGMIFSVACLVNAVGNGTLRTVPFIIWHEARLILG